MSNKESVKSTDISVYKRLDSVVLSVVSQSTLVGFEKAHILAVATGELREILTPQYMAPIMALMGSSIGFKTDRDKEANKYPESVVKECIIEATLWGVQPVGNQFNIIAGNAYITKEGYGYLLGRLHGLSYKIVPSIPKINSDNTGATIEMFIAWTYEGVTGNQTLELPIKMNKFMGSDAVIGKATRKARKWLYDTITGSETPDGDAGEFDGKNTLIIPQDVPVYDDLVKLLAEKSTLLSENEKAFCQRILDNKEENSYAKMKKFLEEK